MRDKIIWLSAAITTNRHTRAQCESLVPLSQPSEPPSFPSLLLYAPPCCVCVSCVLIWTFGPFPITSPRAASFQRSLTPAPELNEVGSVSSRGRGKQWCFSEENRKWQYIHYLCSHSSLPLTLAPTYVQHTYTFTSLHTLYNVIICNKETWAITGSENHFGPTLDALNVMNHLCNEPSPLHRNSKNQRGEECGAELQYQPISYHALTASSSSKLIMLVMHKGEDATVSQHYQISQEQWDTFRHTPFAFD